MYGKVERENGWWHTLIIRIPLAYLGKVWLSWRGVWVRGKPHFTERVLNIVGYGEGYGYGGRWVGVSEEKGSCVIPGRMGEPVRYRIQNRKVLARSLAQACTYPSFRLGERKGRISVQSVGPRHGPQTSSSSPSSHSSSSFSSFSSS